MGPTMVLSWMVMISLGIRVDAGSLSSTASMPPTSEWTSTPSLTTTETTTETTTTAPPTTTTEPTTYLVIADELLLRLTDGPNSCAGNVEIFYFGAWMKVCGHLWDMRDAQVVCKQLGCGQPLGVTGYFPSNGWSLYVMTAMRCQGSEDYLWACPYEHSSSCYDRDASVICSDSGLTAPPPTGSLSSTASMPPTSGVFSCGGLLWDSYGSFQSPNYPSPYPNNVQCVWRIQLWQENYRVNLVFLDVELEGSSCQFDAIEVYDGGLPGGPLLGTVCSNNHHVFISSGNEMAVLFRSDSSVTRKGFQAYYYSIPDHSSTTGSLSSTASMPPTSEWTSTPSLTTTETTTETTTTAPPTTTEPTTYLVIADELLLRLTDGPNSCAGNVEIFYFGAWMKVCGHLWDMRDAQVVCKQLGCGQPLGVTGYFPSNGWSLYVMTAMRCQGSEDYLWACPYEHSSSCYDRDASVICSDSGLTAPPPTGSLSSTASMPPTSEWTSTPSLTTTETTTETTTTAPPTTTTEPTTYLVIADELLLRLTDGPNSCAGNVEIFYFGAWMKVCGHLWDMRDAQVVCKQLGCGQPLGVTGYFPSNGWSLYVMTAMRCQGSEDYLWACPYEHSSSCYDRDASVICSDSGLTAPPPTGSLSSTASMPPTSEWTSTPSLTTTETTTETTTTAPPTTTEPTTYLVIADANYSCGGLLSYSSGTLQSPFYPGNYPNNADCVWEIQVTNNFRITLTFRDVQMQGGRCLSDYVEIYDGPLRTSPLLGKICSGFLRTYTSSSNLMTVHFHSNSRYTYRGFQADYYSIPADQSTTLLCLPDYMRAVVSRAFLQSEGYSASNLSLSDSYCKPNMTPQYVIFDIPYDSCGTVRKGNNNTIIYSNLIRGSSSGSVITRHKRLHLHVNCKMLQNTWTQIMYVAEDNFEVNETQYSRYDVNLTFYHTASFSRPVYDSPYYVDINQNLFLEAYLRSSDSNLVLFVDTCVASPDPYDFTTVTYDIIRNGCPKDSTYTKYYSPYTHVVRFKFSAFQFVRNYPSVYLRCEFVVCRVYDYSSRCYQGCITRSKREASSAQERVSAVAGPIRLQEAGAENRNAELDSSGIGENLNSAPAPADISHAPFIIAVVALAVAGFTLAVFLLKHKLKKPIPYQIM
ncbi:deleted in malignant brain tumors 1 protein isoform X2 [Struthio camelus]|uniref:deleted in malignant brain tumors 1 protein isoform X2 n=1 Tax=Struthio camelus TaxID=8801 RepID=UPI003603C088